jgi:D-amino peptidase
MRIYISADIEGIPGVVSRENLMPGRFEYEQARP